MEWFTGTEIGVWAKSSAFGMGVTETLKRIVRAAGGDIEAFYLWALAMVVTGGSAYMLLTEIPRDALTNPIWFLVGIMMLSTPLSHKLVIMNGAQFIQFLVKKYTGYEMNLKELASGREYKPKMRKLITTESGGQKVVAEDYKTDPNKGEVTVRKLRADETIFNETIFNAPPPKIPPEESEK